MIRIDHQTLVYMSHRTHNMSDTEPEVFTTQYVFGIHTETNVSNPIFCVCSPTSNGWKCRSSERTIMNHDYMSNETFEDVMEWMHKDMNRVYATGDHEEVVELLSKRIDSEKCVGYVSPDPSLSSVEAAERVVQHLLQN